jgi:putative transposase
MSLFAARSEHVSVRRACGVLGIARHTLYPRNNVQAQCAASPQAARAHPRALSAEEQQQVYDIVHSDRFIDQSPRQICATLQSEGQVIASPSTIYRLLARADESTPRVVQRAPQQHAVPRLSATAPNQVWTWDITRLPTQVRGIYLCLYVILDLYSRHVVGWMVAARENAGLAKHLFKQTLTKHKVPHQALTVHQDRGAPMIAHSFRELLNHMGAEPSYSRPRVSNDNAFSESQFRTLKYSASYPGKFQDAAHARAWLKNFFAYYASCPHHGLNGYTPKTVFEGNVDAVHARKQAALNEHYAKHPNRYVKGAPKAKRPPVCVQINPMDGHSTSATAALETERAFAAQPVPAEVAPEVML